MDAMNTLARKDNETYLFHVCWDGRLICTNLSNPGDEYIWDYFNRDNPADDPKGWWDLVILLHNKGFTHILTLGNETQSMKEYDACMKMRDDYMNE